MARNTIFWHVTDRKNPYHDTLNPYYVTLYNQSLYIAKRSMFFF